ncbi:endogenous retrovirus group FC1 Env polyprotein-like isoform X2 [Meriones unguiculatus]|uniref:endogenous retrovirus group FC1 Env polyprotein-like isoform X2 n=1 Tax=Meriones unguiculatus TaxID=10047 RepID=UPI000B4F1E8B|nr:endogenous retrovirus group FC1 Env polyprotein-like isoform X1 [Meriones unguiculatus]XP_021516443.1 endogenous retrovirus group FC1 Env polyprotein-like isoform X2 [Meriones unguiculatus]
MLITCFHVLLESFLAKYTVHFYVVSRALVKIRDRTDHEHIREDQLQQDPAFLNSRGRQDQPPRLQFQRNEASLRQPNSTLLDWIESYCKEWPDRYGGCPYWSCQIHSPAQKELLRLYRKSLFFYIQDPWDPRWETGIVGKLYHRYKPELPISTIYIQRTYIPITQSLNMGEVGNVIKHSSKVIASLTSPLLNNTNLSFRLLLQTLTLAYKLLNVTQPGHFGDCWLCVPPGSSSELPLTASPVTLLSNFTSPFTSCPDSDVAMTPHLFHVTLFGTASCFKASGTHSVGTLSSLDCNKTITLHTPSQPQCSTVLNASILCGTQVYHRLPAGWSGVCTLVLLFPKLGVIHGEEPLPIPVVNSVAARRDKREIQILPLLVAIGLTESIVTRTSGLATSLTLYRQFSSQFIQDFQQVTQIILTLQGQIDSLAAVVLQNR